MILDRSEDDMRRLLVDFNIKWGDRYRFEKAIKEVKDGKPVENNEDGQDSNIHLEPNTGGTLHPFAEQQGYMNMESSLLYIYVKSVAIVVRIFVNLRITSMRSTQMIHLIRYKV